jgi:putative Holliday junction resolvase
MRILGIDFGDKTIGLAISDKLFITAHALGHYRLKNNEEDMNYFKALIAQYDIGEIVVGLPLRMDGTLGTQAEKTKEFVCRLEKALSVPIILWDERLTTQQALKILHKQKAKGRTKKKLKDQVSAAIILSSYLENRQSKSHGP